MCPHESPGRLLESVSNYRSRWMVISLAIARQNPAYRATLLSICFSTHTAERDRRKNLVEVFARVRVNLHLLKGKIAGKRAGLRSN